MVQLLTQFKRKKGKEKVKPLCGKIKERSDRRGVNG